ICEQLNAPGDASTESGIFSRMALQGQTVIAAAGDSGSEECFPTDGSLALGVDDPGAQPGVISAGGTTLVGGVVGTQSVWNDCFAQGSGSGCASSQSGSGGGGYSRVWGRPSWQPAAG